MRRRILQARLPLPVLLDAVGGIGHVGVGSLDEVPDAAQLPLHVLKLILDGLQPLSLLSGHAVHLLVHDLHQGANVALGEDVGANLADDQLLEASGVDAGSLAGVLADIDVRRADVVGVLAALGEPSVERSVARLAPDQSAERFRLFVGYGCLRTPISASGFHRKVPYTLQANGTGSPIPAGPPHVVRYALNSGPGLNIPAWAVYIALAHFSDDHGLSEQTHRGSVCL